MTEIIKEGSMRERIAIETFKTKSKAEKRIVKQFTKITKDNDPILVRQVCDELSKNYERNKLGYHSRFDLDPINGGNEKEDQLKDKIDSWVGSCFGKRSERKIDFIKKIAQLGNEGGVKLGLSESKKTIESDFINSTGINFYNTNLGLDQYKAIIKAVDFASMIGYYPILDNVHMQVDGFLQYNLYQANIDFMKERINSHLEDKSKEYSTIFKATYDWLLKGFFDGEVGSKRERLRYLNGQVEKIQHHQNYNPIPILKWSAIK